MRYYQLRLAVCVTVVVIFRQLLLMLPQHGDTDERKSGRVGLQEKGLRQHLRLLSGWDEAVGSVRNNIVSIAPQKILTTPDLTNPVNKKQTMGYLPNTSTPASQLTNSMNTVLTRSGPIVKTTQQSTKLPAHSQTTKDFNKSAVQLPKVFSLPPGKPISGMFQERGNTTCFIEGTANLTQGVANSRSTACPCKMGWKGPDCSIPSGVYSCTASKRFLHQLQLRTFSRRVIYSLAFNNEFELLEANLFELDDVVDVFVIIESTFTNYGDPRPLLLQQRLNRGYLKQFHHKLIHVVREHIPEGALERGWFIEQHMRQMLGNESMKRVLNEQTDDLFFYTDADELLTRDTLLFLRNYNGYPEPIGVLLKWHTFGFFWWRILPTPITVGCSIGMFTIAFQNDPHRLRDSKVMITQIKSKGGLVIDWYIGDNGDYAGWHCSWCLPPDRIRNKLKSAIRADYPRWGDDENKLDLVYIRSLVKKGLWFDDKTRLGAHSTVANDPLFAPKHLVNNFDEYKHILDLNSV